MKKDPDKAQNIVNEFSCFYRPTFDVIKKQVIELRGKINFIK
jgi:hypothetical protein